jgi:hypothetical protein
MNDEALQQAWTTLEPTVGSRRRMDACVVAWLEAHDTSIATEWVALFGVAPLTSLGLALASAISIAAAPPLIWFARALM